MANVISEIPPPPMYIEQAPPPVIVQAPPPPVVIEQVPPSVIVQAQPPVAVIQSPGLIMVQSPLKAIPAHTTCGFCQQQIVTLTRPVNGPFTWTIFGALLILCIWPFCLIPFCAKSCRDIEHTCPQCRNVIHIHKRM